VEDNRKLLLNCALDLFAARGYDAVGVQEVADAAGLKNPTLYHYFGNKVGLLQTLLHENFIDLFEALEKVSQYDRNVAPTLTAIATVYFSFAAKHRKFYRLQLSMLFAPQESAACAATNAINYKQRLLLEAFFLQAAQDHGNMRERHPAYAATFLGMLNTYISMSLANDAVLDDDLARIAVH
jgi:TetR/AcrR family transcriptional regulator